MRKALLSFMVGVVLLGCSSTDEDDDAQIDPVGDGTGGADGDPQGAAGAGNGEAAYSLGEPVVITSGSAGLQGITQSDHVIYREQSALKAIESTPGASPMPIIDRADKLWVDEHAVLIWSEPDWETNTGDLSVWSVSGGTKAVGNTLLSEDLVAVSNDGSHILYLGNLTETTADLMISTIDMAAPQVLIEGMGRGGEDTCRAKYGFVADSAVIAWCAPGAQRAELVRVSQAEGGEWQSVVLAEEIQPQWSADEEGNRILYISGGSEAWVVEGDNPYKVDQSVGWAMLLPDGSAALYTVSDQLRRSALPEVSPQPAITRDFRNRTAFSSDHKWALFSTEVDWTAGKKENLQLAPTDGVAQSPTPLVEGPIASVSRSAFTADSQWVLYLTEYDAAAGGTLHARKVDGSAEREFTGVYDVLAVDEGVILLSDNRNTENYPQTADLKIIDLNAETEPQLVEERIVSAQNAYALTSAKDVIYTRSGYNADWSLTAANQGMVKRPLE